MVRTVSKRYGLRSMGLAKKRRHKKMLIVSLLSILNIFIFTLVISGIFKLPFLTIYSVVVSGAQRVSYGEVESKVFDHLDGKYFYLFPKSNSLIYPKEVIQADLLSAFPSIKSASINKSGKNTINISLNERSVKAVGCFDNDSGPDDKCFFLDDEGVIFHPTEDGSYSEDTLILYSKKDFVGLNQPFLDKDDFQKLLIFVDSFSENLEKIVSVKLDDNSSFEGLTLSSTKVYFKKNSYENAIKSVLAIIKDGSFEKSVFFKKIEYLDLRFDKKVFYKER